MSTQTAENDHLFFKEWRYNPLHATPDSIWSEGMLATQLHILRYAAIWRTETSK